MEVMSLFNTVRINYLILNLESILETTEIKRFKLWC